MTDSLNKIYDALTEKIKQTNYFVQTLWSWGISAKEWRMANGYDNTHWFYDWAVFDIVQWSLMVMSRRSARRRVWTACV